MDQRPPNVLTCRHCGATMAFARDTCGRCGQPLLLTGDDGESFEARFLRIRLQRDRVRRRWLLATLAVLIVVAAVSAALHYRRVTYTPPSLRAALDAASRAQDDLSAVPAPHLPAAPPAAHVPGQPAAAEPLSLDAVLQRQLDVLRRQPDNADAANAAGQVLVELGRAPEAVAYFDQALQVRPGDTTVRFNRAVALSRGLSQERAAREFLDLSRDTPDDARVHHNLGLVLRRLGRDEEALAAFRRATELAPSEAPGWLGLGLSLDRLGRGDEAAQAFERYLSANPGGPEAEQVRARLAQLRRQASTETPAPSRR